MQHRFAQTSGPVTKPVPYVHQDFPKMKYHRVHQPRVVKNAFEEDKLGPEWADRAFAPEVPLPAATDCRRCEVLTAKFDAAYKKLETEFEALNKQYAELAAEHDALLEQTTEPQNPSLAELMACEQQAA